MVNISRLLFGLKYPGDSLRYHKVPDEQTPGSIGPVVVWNVTRACNLRCRHCYASSDGKPGIEELSTQDALRLIDDLADFKVPVILFSGGEPLIRQDFFTLMNYAVSKGIRVTVSTNGTLIDKHNAKKIKDLGASYVGISLDGFGETNDFFRGSKGAFNRALRGIRNCREAGQKTGLRFTINRNNYNQLDNIFDLVEEEGIARVCFYHLVYSGRGRNLLGDDLSHDETRCALDLIIQRTAEMIDKGKNIEVLTVDNHCDAVYIYLKLLKEKSSLAKEVYNLLRINGGNRSGIAIGQIDWSGDVHPDQFTLNHRLGNIREKQFGDIWSDPTNPILVGLRNRAGLLKGRCGQCRWQNLCNGNFRARAEAIYSDFWAEDPACYLTDEEIGLSFKENWRLTI